MNRDVLAISMMLFLFFIVLMSDGVVAVVSVPACEIYISGSDEVYELSDNIIFSADSTTCLGFLNANNIVVDCKGYSVDCSGNLTNIGIQVWGLSASNNVTLKNCVVKNCGDGIVIRKTSNVTLENITVYNNTDGVYVLADGIASYGSSLFNNLTAVNNTQYGINFTSCGINVTNSIIQRNGKAAFYFDATEAQSCTGSNLTITDNSICYNNVTYIESPNTTITTIANNTFCLEQSYPTDALTLSGNSTAFNLTNVTNPINATDTSCYLYLNSSYNQTNSTVANNDNLFFSSVEFGYNTAHNWHVYCNDTQGNNGNSSVRSFSTINGVTSCADWSSDNYYYLMNDIVGFTDNAGEGGTDGDTNCFRAYNLVNNTFDCQGYSIGGNGNSSLSAFGLWNGTNTTIKNCVVSDFGRGFRGESNNNTGLIYLENMTFQSNYRGYSSVWDSATQLTNVSFSGNNYSIGFGVNDYSNRCNRTFQNVTMDGKEFWYWNGNTSGTLDIDANNLAGFYCCNCANMIIANASNITGSYEGLSFYNNNNMTIRNISIYDSYYGMLIYNDTYFNVSDIFVNNSYFSGIYIYGQSRISYGNYTNIVSNYNNDMGLYVYNSDRTTFENITTHYNQNRSAVSWYGQQKGIGIVVFSDAFYNNFNNIDSRYNRVGFYFEHDDEYTNLTNSVCDFNDYYGIFMGDAEWDERPASVVIENVTANNNGITGIYSDRIIIPMADSEARLNLFNNVTANNNTEYGINLQSCNLTLSNSVFQYNGVGGMYFNESASQQCTDAPVTVAGNIICYNNATYQGVINQTIISVGNNTFCVNQSSPSNTTVSANASWNFTANVSNPLNATDTNCTISFSNGTTIENSTVVDNQDVLFSSAIATANYTWVVNCVDSNGNVGNSTNYSFTADSTGPSSTLIGPSNATEDVDGSLTLTYNVSDLLNVENCSLLVDGVVDSSDTSITQSENQTFSVSSLATGSYNWTVRCYDNLGNTDDATVQYFSVNIPVASDDSSDIVAACNDRKDNDGDGLIDMADPGCKGKWDTSEVNPVQNETVDVVVNTTLKNVTKGKKVEIDITEGNVSSTLENKTRVVKKLEIIFSDDKMDVSVEVLQTEEAPEEVVASVDGYKIRIDTGDQKKEYVAYHYIEVEADVEVESATLQFEVSKEWMDTQGATKDDVVLLHFVNDSWIELETSYISGSDLLLFEATTDGFSVFAVGVEAMSGDNSDEWYLLVLFVVLIGVALFGREKIIGIKKSKEVKKFKKIKRKK
jgi:PGF-pre-PGF domain-containing protein